MDWRLNRSILKMKKNILIPSNGVLVISEQNQPCLIRKTKFEQNSLKVMVEILSTGDFSWRWWKDLKCGLRPGMYVKDSPYSRTRKAIGEGVVLKLRTIHEKIQALIDFYEEGKIIWIPHERLVPIRSVEQLFRSKKVIDQKQGERFRLKCLARALEAWNENTGSLSSMEIDPLPHQIHLVHHILRSGNLNWLIADDVGLGKTIEVGMLLSALTQRGNFRRILILLPSGLVKQWKEEMRFKFGMNDFRIYGTDFNIDYPDDWKMYNHVIGSIDLFKKENHLVKLLQAGSWDLVVFDEAHRLSRRQYGMKMNVTERYRLALAMRQKSDAILLLSGTPHQGMQDKFEALLELLRPDLKKEIKMLSLNSTIISEMIIRNQKSKVSDNEGKLIFKGKETRAVQIEVGDLEKEFDKKIQIYLRKGYQKANELGQKGLAIGFVMAVYRKLATSSIAAIQNALIKRLERLDSYEQEQTQIYSEEDEIEDERFLGEWEESLSTKKDAFFEGERESLKELISKANLITINDTKLKAFLEEIISSIHQQDPNQKTLIFTEYRATQSYIFKALEERYGQGSVVVINGSQSFQEREISIAKFENECSFLVSTEAGGEGINLHRNCHIMVNYDLPWNPMRLVQRLGRLYRYGQKKKVLMFNLYSPNSFDSMIINLMYDRIQSVVESMSMVGNEYNELLADEILGEFVETVDVVNILEKSQKFNLSQTKEEMAEAISSAEEAVKKHREIFEQAIGFDSESMKDEISLSLEHAKAFADGMLPLLRIQITQKTQRDEVYHLNLPVEVIHAVPELRSQNIRITFNRDLASRYKGIEMFDLLHP